MLRKLGTYAQIGLIITTLFLISACGLFGGGSDEPEAEPAAAAQESTSEDASSSDADNSEQAAEDTSESGSDDSAEASTSGDESQGESMITDSGLEIITLEEGSGDKPNSGDIVQVHYVGTLEDGTKFDSSRDRGEPIAFPLGRGAVIPGWDEGIATLNKGGKAKLVIPPDLAYGAAGAGGVIPPNATLHFEVELVDFEEGPPGAPEAPQVVPAADYQETDSGLKYFDFEEGNGASPENGQNVSVHYTGWLTDGTKFDSSLDRGQPFSFPLGQGRVIKGWDEGVATMKIGGKRQLVIPPELGYGDSGAGGVIPGGATLIFEVELLGVQ